MLELRKSLWRIQSGSAMNVLLGFLLLPFYFALVYLIDRFERETRMDAE
jgi:hypothetical protein